MSKTTKEFQVAYKKLNAEQKKAVDTIDGPVMVVAGPGTGKTQTIALRIANILQKTDLNPDSVLALTFTESGARAMRTRLAQMIGVTAYYCHISTFHSFCIEVIKDNPDEFTLDPSVEPLSELEKLKIIHKVLNQASLTHLRPIGAPHHYVRAILGAISDLKREGVRVDQFAELLDLEEDFLKSSVGQELKKIESAKRHKNLAKNRELLILYRAYQEQLKEGERFDFEDMINTVVDAFKKNSELLAAYQERFQYFLVDEYQDTNSAQNQLLLLLANYWQDKANVFVTGDPDQSIMRFQGASIENQLSFIKVYPHAEVITLKKNYRSTQIILDAADELISHNNLRISDVVSDVDPHLVSQSGMGEKISVAELSTATAESIFIAEDILAKVKKGTLPENIAVIYRTNRESALIASTLIKYGLDYTVQGGANVLEDPTVRNFIKILRVIYEMRSKNDDEDLFTILHYDIFNVNALDVLKISRLAADKRINLFEVMANPDLLKELELTTPEQISNALEKLLSWQELEAVSTFTAFFELVLNQSGYLKWVLNQPDAHHRVSRLNTLFDEVKKMNNFDHSLDLAGFIENLEVMEENNLRIEESTFGVSQSAITLTTAHSSKGLEWDHVYIYHGSDGVWGNNQARNLITLPENVLKNTKLSEKEKNEDERRLFYVALTRAKSNLAISYARAYGTNGGTKQSIPTMFLSELGDKRLKQVKTDVIEMAAHNHIEKILTTREVPTYTQEEKEFLNRIVEKFSLSVTALNTYLLCPYLFKLDKLLKVPHAKKSHLAFGTAIHRSLELFYSEFKNTGTRPTKKFLIDAFYQALEKEVITKDDLAVRRKQGEQILNAYFELHAGNIIEPLFLEKSSKVQLGEITLTGKIDRIEWMDQSKKTVRVIDYKTGKGKTTGQIEGTTEDSNGDLKRQLVFYKLLIDLDQRLQNMNFGEAVLDFVQEPSEKAKDGRKRFVVTAEEVEELKKTIISVMSDIKNLQFPRTTNYKTCVTCVFQDHCWPNGVPLTN